EREYTYRLDAPVEMVGIHLVASAEVGKLTMAAQPLGNADVSSAEKGRRVVDFALDGEHESVIYDGLSLKPGMAFDGPAIVEDPGTTIVVNPQCHAKVDAYGNVHIDLSA
ncbi:MAG: hydantoinase/oxoprolinase family protein, partial [Pseudomonadota bacterium]